MWQELLGESIPGGGNSGCKGPEVGMDLMLLVAEPQEGRRAASKGEWGEAGGRGQGFWGSGACRRPWGVRSRGVTVTVARLLRAAWMGRGRLLVPQVAAWPGWGRWRWSHVVANRGRAAAQGLLSVQSCSFAPASPPLHGPKHSGCRSAGGHLGRERQCPGPHGHGRPVSLGCQKPAQGPPDCPASLLAEDPGGCPIKDDGPARSPRRGFLLSWGPITSAAGEAGLCVGQWAGRPERLAPAGGRAEQKHAWAQALSVEARGPRGCPASGRVPSASVGCRGATWGPGGPRQRPSGGTGGCRPSAGSAPGCRGEAPPSPRQCGTRMQMLLGYKAATGAELRRHRPFPKEGRAKGLSP
eukprot:XP_022282202.1 collagen alpha-1(I) chain-like [Canis lupus familiaris]